MFKNALIYRIEHWDAPDLADIEARLAGGPFVECGATQAESSGWVAPRGDRHAALAESVAGHLVLQLCTETKAVPGGVVKTQLQAKLDLIEQETGRRPRGKLARELKDEVVHSLLPRAFPKRADVRVWVDAKAGVVWIGTGSSKRADAVVTRLVEHLGGGLRLAPLQTALSPATAMAHWLAEREAPAGFTVDRECELKQPDGEKAAVRYARHTLDTDEVGEHIRQGKQPTQLAMTWHARVSFVLTEGLVLKKIRLLDLALEGAGATQGTGAGDAGEGGFDADVAITTGELRQLLPDLVAALGGPLERGPLERAPSAEPAPAGAAGQATDAGAPWDPVPA